MKLAEPRRVPADCAGDRGGEVIAVGTPRDLAGMDHSETGRYLKRVFAGVTQAEQVEVAG